jgi:hypothetical protein
MPKPTHVFSAIVILGVALAVAIPVHRHVFVKTTHRCPNGYRMVDNGRCHNTSSPYVPGTRIRNPYLTDYVKPISVTKRYQTGWQDPLAIIVTFFGAGAAVAIVMPRQRREAD